MADIYDFWNTSLVFGASPESSHERSEETVPVNALQSMMPVTSNGQVSTSEFSGFWQDIAKTVVGYAIAKDATKNAVSAQPQVVYVAGQGTQQQQQQTPAGGTVLLMVAALVAVVALSAGGK
jgi:hypothetical protein